MFLQHFLDLENVMHLLRISYIALSFPHLLELVLMTVDYTLAQLLVYWTLIDVLNVVILMVASMEMNLMTLHYLQPEM